MSSPTIKYFGLIRMTKKAYFIVQVVALSVITVLFLATFFADFDKYLLGNARLVLLVVFIFEIVEMFIMLSKYKQKAK